MPTLDNELLGIDIEIPDDPEGALRATPTGDVRLIGGRDNLRAALRRRVTTRPGELLHRPEYGSGAVDYVEELSSPATRAQLANDVRRDLLRDRRLAESQVSVSLADPDLAPDAVVVDLRVQLRRELGDEQLTVITSG